MTESIAQVMMFGVYIMAGFAVVLGLAIGGVVWARRHFAMKGE